MIFDSDVIIWFMKGNKNAGKIINRTPDRHISILTYMELFQGAQNKVHHKLVKDFLKECNFSILQLNDSIGHRASIYMEEYSLCRRHRISF